MSERLTCFEEFLGQLWVSLLPRFSEVLDPYKEAGENPGYAALDQASSLSL